MMTVESFFRLQSLGTLSGSTLGLSVSLSVSMGNGVLMVLVDDEDSVDYGYLGFY
jgi:hypothetical protein